MESEPNQMHQTMNESKRPVFIMRLALVTLSFVTCCVSSGPETAGVAAFGVVVLGSEIAKDAMNQEPSARALWCGTVAEVARYLSGGHTEAVSDDELVEAITPPVHDIARANGYQLHRQQLRLLIADARRVHDTPSSSAQSREACQ